MGTIQAARLLAEDSGASGPLNRLVRKPNAFGLKGNGSDGMARQFQKSLLQANIDRKADGNDSTVACWCIWC